MLTQCVLSAETLLYAVALSGAKGIFGVRNVIAGMTEKDFPALKVRAEDELMRVECGEMDLDGNVTLPADFLSILQSCTQAAKYICLDSKVHGVQQHITYFMGNGGSVRLADLGENYQLLYMAPEVVAADITESMALPDTKASTGMIRLDSEVLEKKDSAALTENGCDETAAKIIADSLSGAGAFYGIQVIEDSNVTKELFFVAGEEGAFQVTLSYADGREEYIFAPITAEDLTAAIFEAVGDGDENG